MLLHVVLTGLLLTPGSARNDDADAKKARDSLKGAWKTVSATRDGDPLPPSETKYATAEIRGDKLIGDGKKPETVSFTLDPKSTPAGIDITIGDGRRVIKGIWKLEKDTLTLCFARGDGDRPTDFKVGRGKSTLVLERVKK